MSSRKVTYKIARYKGTDGLTGHVVVAVIPLSESVTVEEPIAMTFDHKYAEHLSMGSTAAAKAIAGLFEYLDKTLIPEVKTCCQK